ncbi:hypothetical protein BLNAU_24308 [Blattamonas nauphoetae]|uniref:Uncharacterized protein n=1 Tax=Blattamonas nauphoetae TaxID=2049346 RepID=A0ABQ9WMU5_9EUKA|nr:hypothetical protein BLNAU_24308 [Blattamonas nauphoetae]
MQFSFRCFLISWLASPVAKLNHNKHTLLFQLSTSEKRMYPIGEFNPSQLTRVPSSDEHTIQEALALSLTGLPSSSNEVFSLDLIPCFQATTATIQLREQRTIWSSKVVSKFSLSSPTRHALLDDSSFTTTNPFFLVFTTFLNHHVSDNALNSSLLDFRAEMDKFAKARFLFTKTRALSLRPPILPIKLFTLNAYTYIASRMIRRYSTKQTGLPPFGRLVASFPSRGDSRTSTSITGIQVSITRNTIKQEKPNGYHESPNNKEQSTSMTVSIISHDSPNKTSLSTTESLPTPVSVHPHTQSRHPLFFPNHTDLLKNSISSSLFVVPPEERAIALVAAVAVLSEPELILVNTEKLVKNWKQSTHTPMAAKQDEDKL